jgi:hypothetical protein
MQVLFVGDPGASSGWHPYWIKRESSPLAQSRCPKADELHNLLLRERRETMLLFFQSGDLKVRWCVPLLE